MQAVVYYAPGDIRVEDRPDPAPTEDNLIVEVHCCAICGTDLKLMLHPVKGEPQEIKVGGGDGYEHELRHFVDCIANDKKSDVVSPESAIESVKLVEFELASAEKRAPVEVKL